MDDFYNIQVMTWAAPDLTADIAAKPTASLAL
jgi:hypothetical protein